MFVNTPLLAPRIQPPLPMKDEASSIGLAFNFAPEKSYNDIAMNNKVHGSNLQSIIAALRR